MDKLILRTDERVEAVRSLEFAVERLGWVEDDPYQWKWVLIALHNAVQGFIVLALQGSWHVRTLRKDHAKRMIRRYEADLARPEVERSYDWMFDDGKLDYFLELYAKTQDTAQMGMYMHSQAYVPAGTQAVNMEKLNRLRNQFIHFVPVRLIEHVGDWPSIVLDATAVVSFLAFESRNVTWYPGNDSELQARRHLESLFEEANRLTRLYRQGQR